MLDANISCQNGLHSVFELILEMAPNGKYQSIMVDPGIYWRAYRVSNSATHYTLHMVLTIVQLLFSQDNLGTRFRLPFVVLLGKWHVFKEFAMLLWRYYLPSVMGKSFFALFATTKCYVKPQLNSVLTMLAYHFAIFPRIRPILRDALLATGRDGPFHEDLQNLMDLYEVYLPTVCC